jgi:hypothetical protein
LERDGAAWEGERSQGGGYTKLATPNPAGERLNDWKSVFNLTLTLYPNTTLIRVSSRLVLS